MAGGEQTRAAVAAQPEWLRRVPTERRLPPGSVAYTGCGTSYHAAQTGGVAGEALEAGLAPPAGGAPVVGSHEGATPPSLAGPRALSGPEGLLARAPRRPPA